MYRRIVLLVLALSITAAGQMAIAGAAPVQAPAAPKGGLSQADLEEMLGPIALYPDELLANVLAASVYPQELRAAQAYVAKGGDAAKIGEQGWEEPVQAMAKIPDLLKFLTDSMDWTEALGQAYIVQATDVMKAVQTLRAKAKANGVLKNTPEQTIVQDGTTIIIQPANPQVIYVPQYNPQVVYVSSPPPSSGDVVVAGLIGFGIGVAVGACFNDNYYCNWHGGCVGWGWGHGGYHGGYHGDVDIDRNVNIKTGDININSGNTIQGGDRTNIKGGDRNSNNVGREGSNWQPNNKKVDTTAIKNGGAKQLEGYKGVSSNKNLQNTKVPRNTTAQSGRQSPAAVTRDAPPKANTGDNSGRAPTAAPRPANDGPKAPAAKPPTPKTAAPKAQSPAAKSAPAQSKPSGFSPDRGSGAASSRGSSSRGSGGGKSSGGGGGGGGGKRR